MIIKPLVPEIRLVRHPGGCKVRGARLVFGLGLRVADDDVAETPRLRLERVVVITDDLNLPFGTLRLRAKGSDGGHNGLKDIQQVLGTTQYARLRFGIGAEFGKGHQVDYVLGSWSDPELDNMAERLDKSVNALLDITTAGLARAMNTHNGK